MAAAGAAGGASPTGGRPGFDRPPRPQKNSRGRMGTVVSWTVTAFLLALIGAVVFYGASREDEEPPAPRRRLPNVETQVIHPRRYTEALALPARLEARRQAAVSPEFGGKLARWLVGEGQAATEGQVVAELDTTSLQANLKELQARRTSAELAVTRAEVTVERARLGLANAEKEKQVRDLALEAARSELDLARTDHERVRTLVEKQVMDQARLDSARNTLTQAQVRVRQAAENIESAELAVQAAQAQVGEAEVGRALAGAGTEELDAAIDSLRVQIAKANLRAPLSGTLEEHLVEPGEVVASGDVLARIYDLSALSAVVDVPDRYVAFLDDRNAAVADYIRLERPGAEQQVAASVLIPGLPRLTGGEQAGLELRAEIARISQSSDPQSNTFPVELRLQNPAGALRHGLLVRARIEYLSYAAAIVIPVRAVQATDAGPRVMVAAKRGGVTVAETRDVAPASIREHEIMVLSGLAEGDRLIVTGWKGLVSGQEVNVVVENGVLIGAGGGDPE